jgi:hypothetical protein
VGRLGASRWVLVVAGVVLIAAGIGLRAWSIATLGRFFQYQIQVQPGHQVVTDGPYRCVRHPSYSGIALVLTGIALACDDVWSLLAVAVLGGAGLAGARLASYGGAPDGLVELAVEWRFRGQAPEELGRPRGRSQAHVVAEECHWRW